MKKRPLLLLLAAAATLGPAAGCRCSGDPQGNPTAGGPGAQGTGTGESTGTGAAALAEQSFKLANGMQVDLVSGDCGEGAALGVLVHGGIDHDPAGRSGMARLAGRVLATAAPEGRAPRTVETGGDYMVYSATASGDRLLEELDEVAAWMSKTGPSEADLSRERTRMLEELGKLAGADAAATAVSLAEEAVTPARGHGKRNGIAKEVEAITIEELRAYWQERFKPGNARITVAGRFDVEKVKGRIEAAFGGLPAGTAATARDPGDTTVRGTLVMGEAPAAVAVAVPAPGMADPLFAPFLILAARLLEKPAAARTWEVAYDPIRRPELLLVTGPVGQAEQPEPAAARMRTEMGTLLDRPLAPEDVAKTRERFRLLVEPKLVDAELCAADARGFAVARMRRDQLGTDAAAIGQALEATTNQQLEEAAKLFGPKRTAAVIAGGAIR